MRIVASAAAGTLESNDALVRVEPGRGQLELEISSIVLQQFGAQIEQAARECAQALDVSDARIIIDDKGAIRCTLMARVETALRRAGEVQP